MAQLTPKRSTRSNRGDEELVQLSDARGSKPKAVAQAQARAVSGIACRNLLPVCEEAAVPSASGGEDAAPAVPSSGASALVRLGGAVGAGVRSDHQGPGPPALFALAQDVLESA